MFDPIVSWCRTIVSQGLKWVETQLLKHTKPNAVITVVGATADLVRSKQELVIENAFLLQQLVILARSVKRPTMTTIDRGLLVVLASRLKAWWEALLVVKPDTLLGWHRKVFASFWRQTSNVAQGRQALEEATVALIKQMISDNPLWGAERIRGELLKVGVKVAKSTIQKYMRQVRPRRPQGQTWLTFLHQHAKVIWACDFLPVIDLVFRQYFAFFIVELGSRQVVHVGVTDAPTDAWTAQLLREATPFGEGPKYLIHDRDSKFGTQFARVAAGANIKVLKTPVRAPNANAVCERFLGSVRRECLDHLFFLGPRQLLHVLKVYNENLSWEACITPIHVLPDSPLQYWLTSFQPARVGLARRRWRVRELLLMPMPPA